MKSFSSNSASPAAPRAYFAFAVSSTLLVPLALSFFEYRFEQTFLAVTFINICLYPTARFYARNEGGLPALAMLCWAYAIQFALPLITREAAMELAGGETYYLDEEDVTYALILSIIGVSAFQTGYYLLKMGNIKKAVPTFNLHLNEKKAIIYCIVVGLLLPLILSARWIIPEQLLMSASSILTLLQNQILVAIAILGWLVYTVKVSRRYRLLLYGLVAISVSQGFSNASLETALVPIVVLSIVRWIYTRRLPVWNITAALSLALFLSPVKGDFRQMVWYEQRSEATLENMIPNALLWVNKAADYWVDSFNGDNTLAESSSALTGRADLLHQFAYICALTPSRIPYQYGGTYAYFSYALIPRMLWPEKPQAGDSNKYYAVTYGITTEEGATTTTFGVSLLGEGYINFGIYGVVLIMFLQGLIVGLVQYAFAGPDSGPGGQAVFLAFFVFFLNGIGSSAEVLFGNILQNLLCGYLLLWWAREGTRPQGKAVVSLGQLTSRSQASA